MRLVQYLTKQGERRVAIVSETRGALLRLRDTQSVYQLAREAIIQGITLTELAGQRADGESVDYETIVSVGRLLPPLDHPDDPAHCLISGVGLTHLGSADVRDRMHQQGGKTDKPELSDSMKLFNLSQEQGKSGDAGMGVQPQWFYKGDGSCVVAPGHAFEIPAYALDGGEEAEIVGLYIIADDGTPYRIGFALGNELADHVMENQNYLYLAHSKLRPCSFGPELLLGNLPAAISGTSRLLRDGKVLWEKTFNSGEQHMTHTIASLEYHYFKYRQFRRPGDVHVYFLGTAILSYADQVKTRTGDVFEISAEGFGLPLRNSLKMADAGAQPVISVKSL
jgi:hypothetical protein